MNQLRVASLIMLAGCVSTVSATVADFEDLTLGAESFYNGSDGAGGFFSHAAYFPNQYDTFMRTVDHERTRFGGSETFPQEPSDDDPRTEVPPSKLEHIPQLKRMWDGYAFAID